MVRCCTPTIKSERKAFGTHTKHTLPNPRGYLFHLTQRRRINRGGSWIWRWTRFGYIKLGLRPDKWVLWLERPKTGGRGKQGRIKGIWWWRWRVKCIWRIYRWGWRKWMGRQGIKGGREGGGRGERGHHLSLLTKEGLRELNPLMKYLNLGCLELSSLVK
jgi:hypothetical protein